MIKHRLIYGNKSNEIPRRLVFFDTETLPAAVEGKPECQDHSLRLGVVTAGRYRKGKYRRSKELAFRTPSAFFSFLVEFLRPRETTWVFAHSMGFDSIIVGLWEQIDAGEFKWSFSRAPRFPGARSRPGDGPFRSRHIMQNIPFALHLEHKHGGRVRFVDTLNYWRTRLSSLGESMGMPKMDMPPFDSPDAEWLPYCANDVYIIEKAVGELITFWVEHDLGMFRQTAPGLSMSAYRHKFMAHKINTHDEPDCRAIERAGYFGGEIRNNYCGRVDRKCYAYDVTSLYPSVMAVNRFPCRLLDFDAERPLQPGKPEKVVPQHAIAEVLLETPETFPRRLESDVYYATGVFPTTLAGPELAYAWKQGYIRKWGRWASYLTRPIFKDFVEYFWARRLEYHEAGNKVWETFIKLILNSHYGKWAQMIPSWVIVPEEPPIDNWGAFWVKDAVTKRVKEYHAIAGMTWRQDPPCEHPVAFPAIAAFVTAHARQVMREARRVVGGRNWFYQHTDSIYCNAAGHRKLKASGLVGDFELGKFSLDGAATDAEFVNLNYYFFDGDWTCGGRKFGATEVKGDSWKETHAEALLTYLKRERPPDSKVRFTEQAKERSRHYRKGSVDPDGWVTPCVFDGDVITNLGDHP